MSETTAIEWCDSTFNPWIGCTRMSPACDDCYAARSTPARALGVVWGPHEARRRTSAGNWALPLRWQAQADQFMAEHGRRRRVFCASLADVFDNAVPPEWRADLFKLIEATPNLDWLLLTKRIGNAANMMFVARGGHLPPLPNFWLGATVVTQAEADRDIPKLLATPARVRFLSMEPLLGPVDISPYLADFDLGRGTGWGNLHWVIAGGESGPQARPSHPDWFRSLRDQCAAAGVPFLFKQWGAWWEVASDERDPETGDHNLVDVPSVAAIERFDAATDCLVAPDGHAFKTLDDLPDGIRCRHMTRLGKKAAGRLLDGQQHDGFPEVS